MNVYSSCFTDSIIGSLQFPYPLAERCHVSKRYHGHVTGHFPFSVCQLKSLSALDSANCGCEVSDHVAMSTRTSVSKCALVILQYRVAETSVSIRDPLALQAMRLARSLGTAARRPIRIMTVAPGQSGLPVAVIIVVQGSGLHQRFLLLRGIKIRSGIACVPRRCLTSASRQLVRQRVQATGANFSLNNSIAFVRPMRQRSASLSCAVSSHVPPWIMSIQG
jgi:hypothetical protein